MNMNTGLPSHISEKERQAYLNIAQASKKGLTITGIVIIGIILYYVLK